MKKYTNMHSDNNLEQTLSTKSLLQINNNIYSWINDFAWIFAQNFAHSFPSFASSIFDIIFSLNEGSRTRAAQSLIQE